MWSQILFSLCVGLAYASSNPGWQDYNQYVYSIDGRTLSSLQQASDHYSGIFLKAKLYISPRSDGNLDAQIKDAQYTQVQSQFPKGWNTEISESELSYKQLPISENSFLIVYENGVIKSLSVEEGTPNWEANIIKSIVSQFQMDVNGQNAREGLGSDIPSGNSNNGVFKSMEKTVTGEYETYYDIHAYPEYLLQSKPWLAPLLKSSSEDDIIEVAKYKNHTNSEENPSYHYGFGDIDEWETTSNSLGQFFIRSSESNAIITGRLNKFTIQNSYTVNKIMANPILENSEMGSVISMVNVTLESVNGDQTPKKMSSPKDIGDLVYSYDHPFAKNNDARKKTLTGRESERSAEGSWRRHPRSVSQTIQKQRGEQRSDEHDQTQPKPQMNRAPEFPLLPTMVGYKGQSIKQNGDFDVKESAARLANEISDESTEPEQLLEQSTLNKYTLLCTLMRLMDKDEMQSLAEQFYPAGATTTKWRVVRDAIAEAGTLPAYSTIQKLIISKSIKGFEAGQVVETMSKNIRTPTEEFMKSFFELIQKSEVKQQEFLNQSAILSFSHLAYNVYTNDKISHNQYPSHAFEGFNTENGKKFVRETVVPYFKKQLDEAIQAADTRKIHTYIYALGNTGDQSILSVFEPYLEGQQQVSQFQRFLMVLNLEKLVEVAPEVARSVLYKIYQNTGEIPEMRAVAAVQLMKSNPPAEMIQRMAEKSNSDPQGLVNAAVKYTIESLSELKGAKFEKLRQSAQSARPILTPKQEGQNEYYTHLHNYVIEQMGAELFQHSAFMGSEESNWAKGARVALEGRLNGMFNRYFSVDAMSSSIRELYNVLYRQTASSQQNKGQSGSQYSSIKIAQLINYEGKEREQLEAVINGHIQQACMHFSLDNHTLENLPEVVRQLEQDLKDGKPFDYIKMRQMRELALSYPTEMGLPFLYTYDLPLFVKLTGNIKASASPAISRNNKLHKPDEVAVEIEAELTISGKAQSGLTFITPFDHQEYIAGYERNFQVHVPLKAHVDADMKETDFKVELDAQETHKGARMLHYSTYPYTSRGDILDVVPTKLRPNTHVIKRDLNQHTQFNFEFGKKQVGVAFRAWGHHPAQTNSLGKLTQVFQSQGLVATWNQIWDKAALEYTEANIAYIPNQSSTRKAILRLKHSQGYKSEPESSSPQDFLTISQLSSNLESTEAQKRQQELLNHVGAGIYSAKWHADDLSIQVDSTGKQFVVGFVSAKSDVDPKSRTLIYYKNQDETKYFSWEGKAEISNTNGLDLAYSLKNEPSAEYWGRLQYGESDEKAAVISGRVSMRRSDERKQYLAQEDPLYNVCSQQMNEGNRQLAACQNMTIRANFLDSMEYQIKYLNIAPRYAELFEDVYKGAHVYFYPMVESRSIDSEGENLISGKVQFEPKRFESVNITVRAQNEEIKFFNLSSDNEYIRNVWVPHPVFHLKSRMSGAWRSWQNYRPTCVVDQTAAQTFSNKTYPMTLPSGLTVVMQYIPSDARQNNEQSVVEQLKTQSENYVVLAKEESGKRELIINFNTPQTKSNVEINMKPKQNSRNSGSSPVYDVYVNKAKADFNDQKAADYYDGSLQIYALPNGEVKVEIEDAFYLIADGQRVKLTATSGKLRESTYGLCGRFTFDKYEDFTVPRNCVVKDSQKFVESYQVESRGSNANLQNECVAKVLPLYADVISDQDNNWNNKYMARSSRKSSGTQMRHRYVEENGELCFTIHPLPSCNNRVLQSSNKKVAVHCIEGSKTAYFLKAQIDKGGNPDFSHKSETKKISMEVPLKCN